MSLQTACPDRIHLLELLDGTLPPDQEPGLTGHLESCTACQQTLQQLAAGGESWEGAARELGKEAPAADPALGRILRDLQADGFTAETQAEPAGAADLPLAFLAPPEKPERLDRSGPLAIKEVLRIGMQTAAGLAAAHAQGLVHRDVKPANILLENGVERVKLTDFGLARAVDDASVSQSGVVAGTPQYMAPEQAEGQAVDHRSDLFSLGSVLYVMCTGRPPFRATGTMAVLKRVIESAPRSVSVVN